MSVPPAEIDGIFAVNDSKQFNEFIRSPGMSVVHFAAKFVDQCEQVTKVIKELSVLPEVKAAGTKFCIVDAENLDEQSEKYKVTAVPTVILFKNGVQIDRIDGVDAAQLTAKVKGHSMGKSIQVTSPPKQRLEERLKMLINRHKVMVFMKGDRNVPKCGFSRTLIQILNGTGVEYDTFDILTDEEVRQGLKEYSDWPTYPQLYVKGELIGGLDIIKELQASGEFEATLEG